MKSKELCRKTVKRNLVLCTKVLFKLALNKAVLACKDLLFSEIECVALLHERKKDEMYSD